MVDESRERLRSLIVKWKETVAEVRYHESESENAATAAARHKHSKKLRNKRQALGRLYKSILEEKECLKRLLNLTK